MASLPADSSISLCMIAKDEAENLARCLDSVCGFVDEMVVVDTGSSDATCEIALRYGARLFHMVWPDDFSVARNYSISLARMAWVFVLDADEAIARQDGPRLKLLAARGSADAFTFTTRNHTDDFTIYGWVAAEGREEESRGNAGWVPSKKIRLFRNHAAISFSGAVHESVENSVREKALRAAETDIPIHHYGKAKGVVHRKAKSKLYAAIGEKRKRAGGISEKELFELAVEQKESGNYLDAGATLHELIKLNPAEPKYHLTLACALEAMGKLDDSTIHYKLALALGDEIPQAHNNLGLICHRLGRKEQAFQHFKKALDGFCTLEHAGPNDPRVKAVMSNLASVLSEGAEQNVAARLKQRMKQKLSLCMIVRDEEANLPRCLDSARGLVDEIVVVDTGSEDGTMSVAKAYGAKIIESKWQDDFSRARNLSLATADGDWALVLDADERLDPHDHEEIRSAIDSGAWSGISFRIMNYGPGSNLISIHYAARAFRRTEEAKFSGKAHEEVLFSGPELPSGFAIHHYGYGISAQALERKLLRDLALINEELEKEPGNLPKAYYLARTLFTLGRYGEAADRASRALDELKRLGDASVLRLLLAELAAASLLKLGEIVKAEKVCAEALAICPYFADALFTYASIMAEKNDLGRAKTGYERYLKALALLESDPAIGFNFKSISTAGLEARARGELGRICMEMGFFDQSVRHLRQAAALEPSGYVQLLNLAAAYERLGDYADARACYLRAASLGAERKNIATALARLNAETSIMRQSGDKRKGGLTANPVFALHLSNSLWGI